MRIWSIFIFFFLQNVWADVGTFLVGNGGDALVCYKNPSYKAPLQKKVDDKKKIKAQSVQLLDFYEGETLQGLKINLSDEYSVKDNVEVLLSRLSAYGDDFSVTLRKYFSTFFEEALFLDGVRLTNIEDSYHLVTPIYCAVEQIAIQTLAEYPGDPRYIINQDLWDLMPSSNQAGLILHELLYRFLVEHRPSQNEGPLHSINVRRLTSLVASDSLSLLGLEGFVNFLVENFFFDCLEPVYDEKKMNFSCKK